MDGAWEYTYRATHANIERNEQSYQHIRELGKQIKWQRIELGYNSKYLDI